MFCSVRSISLARMPVWSQTARHLLKSRPNAGSNSFIVPVGVIAPDHVVTPAPLVDYLITNG